MLELTIVITFGMLYVMLNILIQWLATISEYAFVSSFVPVYISYYHASIRIDNEWVTSSSFGCNKCMYVSSNIQNIYLEKMYHCSLPYRFKFSIMRFVNSEWRKVQRKPSIADLIFLRTRTSILKCMHQICKVAKNLKWYNLL